MDPSVFKTCLIFHAIFLNFIHIALLDLKLTMMKDIIIPYHVSVVAAEIKTLQIRQHFFNLLLPNFGELIQIVAPVS